MPKIAFLFPGQGAQAVGMGRELDAELPAARALFDRAGEVLGFDLRRLCFEGPAEALEATDVSQPAIFVASLAALEGLKASQPDVVAALRGGRRAEPGRIHGPGLRRRARLRGRPAGRPPPRRGDAGRGRSPRPAAWPASWASTRRKIDELCRRVAAARPALEGQHARPRQHRRLGRASGAWRRSSRSPPSWGRMKVDPAGRRRGLPHPPDEAGRRPAGRGPGRRPTIQPPRIPVYSNVDAAPHADPDEIRRTLAAQVDSAASAGKTRSAGCSPTASTPSTRSAPAAS